MRPPTGQGPAILKLTVRREEIYQDTLDQLSTLPETALSCPLRVQFAGEEGVDEGGLVKEFFHLVMPKFFRWGRKYNVASGPAASHTSSYAGTLIRSHALCCPASNLPLFYSRALVPMDNDGLRWFWFSAPTEKNLQAYHWYVVMFKRLALLQIACDTVCSRRLSFFTHVNHGLALDCCTAWPL